MTFSNLKRISSAVAAVLAASLAACSGPAATTLPPESAAFARPHAAPKACKGQTTTSEYASTTGVKFKAHNAHACIPAFGGFGGTLRYPAAAPGVGATLTSSTKNYNNMLPVLSKGKPIFYLQIATTAATDFAASYKASGGLTSKAIKPGKTYYVYGQSKINSVASPITDFTPCRTTAVTAAGGGALPNLGTPLEGQNVPGSANIVIEVYEKGSATAPC